MSFWVSHVCVPRIYLHTHQQLDVCTWVLGCCSELLMCVCLVYIYIHTPTIRRVYVSIGMCLRGMHACVCLFLIGVLTHTRAHTHTFLSSSRWSGTAGARQSNRQQNSADSDHWTCCATPTCPLQRWCVCVHIHTCVYICMHMHTHTL